MVIDNLLRKAGALHLAGAKGAPGGGVVLEGTNTTLLKWSLARQNYNMQIIHIKSNKNVNATVNATALKGVARTSLDHW